MTTAFPGLDTPHRHQVTRHAFPALIAVALAAEAADSRVYAGLLAEIRNSAFFIGEGRRCTRWGDSYV